MIWPSVIAGYAESVQTSSSQTPPSLHITPTMSRAPSNPFYAGGPAPPSGGSSNAPPPYSTSTRPVPAIPSEPVTYTSLSDLTRGKQQKPTANTFSYEPSSQRAGYREGGPVQNETFGTGQGARRTLPPDPQAGRERSLVPPKRTVAGRSCRS
jgi:hypothetical protein